MTRDESLAEVKGRALELARAGDVIHAVATLVNWHDDPNSTEPRLSDAIVMAGMTRAMNDDRKGVIAWIEGLK